MAGPFLQQVDKRRHGEDREAEDLQQRFGYHLLPLCMIFAIFLFACIIQIVIFNSSDNAISRQTRTTCSVS